VKGRDTPVVAFKILALDSESESSVSVLEGES